MKKLKVFPIMFCNELSSKKSIYVKKEFLHKRKTGLLLYYQLCWVKMLSILDKARTKNPQMPGKACIRGGGGLKPFTKKKTKILPSENKRAGLLGRTMF